MDHVAPVILEKLLGPLSVQGVVIVGVGEIRETYSATSDLGLVVCAVCVHRYA
jgi:hypothetical protein